MYKISRAEFIRKIEHAESYFLGTTRQLADETKIGNVIETREAFARISRPLPEPRTVLKLRSNDMIFSDGSALMLKSKTFWCAEFMGHTVVVAQDERGLGNCCYYQIMKEVS